MKPSQIFLGELIGTFILVYIGCGSVALAVVYEFLTSIYEVALCWTIGVILGIYSSSKLSGAHLNPAVSAAFLVDKQISPKSFIVYLLAQFIGAFTAGLTLFLIIQKDIIIFSTKTACIFGEYFPNPTYDNFDWVTLPIAMLTEFTATFILVYLIFVIVSLRKINKLSPTLIGITVGILICISAPYTQCCMNPARDLGPRIVSYFFGWEKLAFSFNETGWFTVYILSPMLGGVLGALTYIKTLKKRLS